MTASLPLRGGGAAMRIFAHPAIGAGGYNGLSPYPGHRMNGAGPNWQDGATGQGAADAGYGPVQTWAQAMAIMGTVAPPAAGAGHQIMLAEGQAFTDSTIYRMRYGNGPAYPTCWRSYDPAAPADEARYGRATGANRPVILPGNDGNYWGWIMQTFSPAISYFVFQGLDYAPPQPDGVTIQSVDCTSFLMFENCVLRGVSISVDNNSTRDFAGNIVLRKCLSYFQYATSSSHVCGMHTGWNGVTVEDCVFIGNGIKDFASRSSAVSAGGADIYKHGWYAAFGGYEQMISRRNVFIEGSATGLSGRGHMWAYHNWSIDNPIAMTGGDGVADYAVESPNGVMLTYDCNFTMGGQDITASLPRGYGFAMKNGVQGSTARRNLFVNNPKYGAVNNRVFLLEAGVDQPSHLDISGTRSHAYSATFANPASGQPFPARRLETLSDNVTSATSPATNVQVYARVGALAGVAVDTGSETTARASVVAAMMADHLKPWALLGLQAGAELFGHDLAYDAARPVIDGVPVIAGVAQVGHALTASAPTGQGVVKGWRWYKGSIEIAGQTGATYTPVAGDAGSTITAVVLFQKPNKLFATARSAATATVTSA